MNGEKPDGKNPTRWFSGQHSQNSTIITISDYKQGILSTLPTYSWIFTLIPNRTCSDSSPFWCMTPKYVTNQLRGSQYATSITNLKRLLAAEFFSSSTRWRSGRYLVTKPYGANTQQLLQERDELGQELYFRSQFAWTEFT